MSSLGDHRQFSSSDLAVVMVPKTHLLLHCCEPSNYRSGTVSPSFAVEETEPQKAHHLPRAAQLVHAKDVSKHQSYGVNIPREFTCVSWV